MLLVHLLVAVGWVGVDLVIGALSFTGLTTDDPRTMATAYRALGLFAVPLLLALGLGTLVTGVVLARGTGVGLTRHWWVLGKLLVALVLTTLVLVALRPVLDEATRETAVVDASLPDRLQQVRVDLVFPPVVSTTALVLATWLGVARPWGRTPFARLRRRGSG